MPAVRADQRRAASRQVQHGLRAGRVQQRAGTQDDVAVDGTGGRIDIGLPVQRAADLDGAAGLHRAIAPAWRRSPHGCGRRCPAHLLADPDRTGIGGHIGLLALTRLLDGNAAAPGIEPAQHGDLVGAPDLDRAAGIDDADARPRPPRWGRLARPGPSTAPGRRRRCVSVPRSASRYTAPASSASGRRRAGARTGRLRGAALQPQHRHEHVDLRAVRDGQALVAVDLVLAGGAEQRRVQPQRGGVLRIKGPPSTILPPLATDSVPPPVTP